MKMLSMITVLSLVAMQAYGATCGTITKFIPGGNTLNTITLASGQSLVVEATGTALPLFMASMASNLTVCFSANPQDQYYSIDSISK